MERLALQAGVEQMGIVTADGGLRMLHGAATADSIDAGAIPIDAAAVIHTHPGQSAFPSVRDQAQQIATDIPWIIVPRGGQAFAWGGDLQPPALVGRPFRWGVTDCYAALRDGLRELTGQSIPDFPRAWQFWRSGEPLFEKLMREAGFRRVSTELCDAEPGDAIMFWLKCKVANHCALVIAEGTLFHHPTGGAAYDPSALARVEATDRYARLPLWVCRLDA